MPLTHEVDQSNIFFSLVQGYVEPHASYMNNVTGSSEGGWHLVVYTDVMPPTEKMAELRYWYSAK